jgi:hypothetical protein
LHRREPRKLEEATTKKPSAGNFHVQRANRSKLT